MAEFIVEGGFDVPVKKLKSGALIVDIEEMLLLANENRSFSKYGCYIYSRKSSRGSTPIYVGKAQEQKIIDRAFADGTLKKVMD